VDYEEESRDLRGGCRGRKEIRRKHAICSLADEQLKV